MVLLSLGLRPLGGLARPLAALCLRPRATAQLLRAAAPRRAAHSLGATSVTVRAAAAADREAPASFGQLGVSTDLQVRWRAAEATKDRLPHILSLLDCNTIVAQPPPHLPAVAAVCSACDAPSPCPALPQAALAEKGISEPTEIQAEAVPALLRDQSSDFILASHTGSGKTLAYLLPIGALALCTSHLAL